jgi:hypothetical protein
MEVQATYSGEELSVTFVAQTERSDYGVPNSPVWDEVNPDTIEILTFDILGIDVDPAFCRPNCKPRSLRFRTKWILSDDKHLPYHLCAR